MLPASCAAGGLLYSAGLPLLWQAARTMSSAASVSKIGFIGLGHMGKKMAMNLLDSGHELVVYDTNKLALERAINAGSSHPKFDDPAVHPAATPAEVAATPGVDVLFTMLPSRKSVMDVYLGQDGVFEAHGGVRPSIMVDCSTLDPVSADTLAEASRSAKLHPDAKIFTGLPATHPAILDAPVAGTVHQARTRELSFIVGGDPAALPVIEPLLRCMGKSVSYCGEHGKAHAAKLCNAIVRAASMAAVAEALALGKRLGLDPKVLSQIINSSDSHCGSSDQYNPVPGVVPDNPASKGYKAGLSANMIIEWLEMIEAAAQHAKSPVPMTRTTKELYHKIAAEGLGVLDYSSIYRYVYGAGARTHEWDAGEKLFSSQIP